jgi:hypothetical protein
MAVTDAEDVAEWAGAISRWMQQRGDAETVSLTQLQQGLGMQIVEVWLGLLLSQEQYEWEQRGEFYNLQGIWFRQRCFQK